MGRKVEAIQLLVARFVLLNQEMTTERSKRDQVPPETTILTACASAVRDAVGMDSKFVDLPFVEISVGILQACSLQLLLRESA